jgi:hypothetical protein
MLLKSMLKFPADWSAMVEYEMLPALGSCAKGLVPAGGSILGHSGNFRSRSQELDPERYLVPDPFLPLILLPVHNEVKQSLHTCSHHHGGSA